MSANEILSIPISFCVYGLFLFIFDARFRSLHLHCSPWCFLHSLVGEGHNSIMFRTHQCWESTVPWQHFQLCTSLQMRAANQSMGPCDDNTTCRAILWSLGILTTCNCSKGIRVAEEGGSLVRLQEAFHAQPGKLFWALFGTKRRIAISPQTIQPTEPHTPVQHYT